MGSMRTMIKLAMVLAAALLIPALVACEDAGAPNAPGATPTAKLIKITPTEDPTTPPTQDTSDS